MPALPRPRVLSHPEAGFSLLATSVLLLAAALVFVSVLPGKSTNQETLINAQKMQAIDKAMIGFMAQNGRRPCPALGSAAINTAAFGAESGSPGICQGTLGPDASGNLVAGAVPTKAIYLPDSYAIDASGHRFTYVVDRRATVNGTCQKITVGGITIQNTMSTGGTVLDHTTYAYVSSPSGDGMWPAQGGNRNNTGNGNIDMINNSAMGGANTWLTTSTLVQQPKSKVFDNMVWYRPDLKNTCNLTPPNSPDNCPLSQSQGGGTLNNGQSLTPEYPWSAGASCPVSTLTCTNGTLYCSGSTNLSGCQYYNKCSVNGCVLTANQGGGSLPGIPPGNTATEYADTSDLSCTQNTLTCNGGTPSCSTGNMSGCQYNKCSLACGQGTNPGEDGLTWGGTILSGASVTAYQSATVTAPTTCASVSQPRTCTNGVLSGSYTNQTCSQTCTLTANQGGGTLNVGNTKTPEFASQSAATCTQNTLTCNSSGLSCSDGNISDCQYNTCTPTGGITAATIWETNVQTNMVALVDSSGYETTEISCPCAGGNAPLSQPQSIAFDGSVGGHGALWVVDSGNNLVREFGLPPSANGNAAQLQQFDVYSYGAQGVAPLFSAPWGIAYDANGGLGGNGTVWVTDSGHNRVMAFNAIGGTMTQVFPVNAFAPSSYCSGSPTGCPASAGNGAFDNPMGIAYGNGAGGNPAVWVVDSGNNRVQEFDPVTGYPIQTIPPSLTLPCQTSSIPACPASAASGQFDAPEGIAVDGNDVWVVDTYNNRIQEFAANTTFLIQTIPSASVCTGGFPNDTGYPAAACPVQSAGGQFNHPEGITVDASGNLWVADTRDGLVQEFDKNGNYRGQITQAPALGITGIAVP